MVQRGNYLFRDPPLPERIYIVAAAVSRWRSIAPVHCSRVDDARAPALGELHSLIEEVPSTIDRRRAARARLLAAGKLDGFSMKIRRVLYGSRRRTWARSSFRELAGKPLQYCAYGEWQWGDWAGISVSLCG